MIFFYLLISLMPYTNPPLLSRFMGDFAAFRSVGALSVIYALYYLATRWRASGFFRTVQARLFFLFYLIATVSYFSRSLYPNPFTSALMVYTSFVVLFFVTLTIVDSPRRFYWVLFSATAAVTFGSLHVLREWVMLRNVYANYRAGASVGDGNYFATSANLCLPFAYLMIARAKARWERLFYGGCLAISIVGVTLCASRGGFIGMVVAFLVLILYSRRRLRNLALAGILVVPLSLALPMSPLRRLRHPQWTDKAAEDARLTAWKAGMRMISSHPVFGVGLNNFQRLMRAYADPGVGFASMAHNTYIEVGAELGITGLLTFMGVLVFSYRSLSQARKRALRSGSQRLSTAAFGLQAGLAGYMAGAFFLSAEYQKLLWLVIFLSMCLPPPGQSAQARKAGKDGQGEHKQAAQGSHWESLTPEGVLTSGSHYGNLWLTHPS
jgi:O-antigen ligase